VAGKVLLIGYGNPGRFDDGLGPALAERIEEADLEGVNVQSAFQLGLEDAEALSRNNIVIFADAARSGPEPFRLEPVRPASTFSFTTHSVSPGAVVALAAELFAAQPKAFLLGIRGYVFDGFGSALSEKAAENLQRAVSFLLEVLHHGDESFIIRALEAASRTAERRPSQSALQGR